MNYYKITNQREVHNYMRYKDGLNVDVLPFNPTGDCQSGGIYFASTDILAFLDYGPWIRKVIIPEGETIYENPSTLDNPKKYKSHSVFLEPRRRVNAGVIKKLIEEGANIHAGNDNVLKWASAYGHLDIVKFLVEKGADIHTRNDLPLCLASESGHLNIVKFLVEKGADIHASDDYSLKSASFYGHLNVVKFLVEKQVDIHAEDDYAFRLASKKGHLNIVRFLIEKGADIHAKDGYALKWARTFNHLNVVKFLEKIYKIKNELL